MSVFGWVVPALAAFIAIPITVRGLGADQYGLLALTAALTGYLGLLEMGLGSALVRYLSYYRALRQGKPMVGLIWFGVRWFGAVGLAGAVFLLIAAPWLSTGVLKVPADLVTTAVIVLRLTGLNFLLAMLVSVGTAIPQSFLRYDIGSTIAASIGTLAAVGPAVIVSLGYGLVPVVVYSLFLNAGAIGVYACVGYLLMRQMELSEGPAWKEIRRKTFSFAGLTALNTVGYTVAQQTSKVVVGVAEGVAAAAYYQVPYNLASRVNDMLAQVAQVLFPTASALLATHDMERVRELYLRSSRLLFLLNFSVSVGLCALAYPFLKYWLSTEYAVEGSLALTMFALSQALHATSMAATYVNLSAARPGINLAFSLSASAVSLALIYPLTVWLGVDGAALAGLIAAVNVPFFLHYGHKHVLGLSSWRVWRQCYSATTLGTLLTGVAAYYALRPLCTSLLTTLAAWGLTVVVSMVVSGLLGAVSRADLVRGRGMVRAAWQRILDAGGRGDG